MGHCAPDLDPVSQLFDYSVRVRLKRDNVLLTTQNLRKSAENNDDEARVQHEFIPNTWVDNGASAGEHTYTLTLEFFQRTYSKINITAETRSLNAVVFS